MTQGKIAAILLVLFVIGFGAEFVLRPVIAPPITPSVAPTGSGAQSTEARGI